MAADGSIVSWGGGEHGQTGHGKDNKVPLTADKIILDSITSSENCRIACGASYTVCISGGNVFVWGNGSDGQLGTGSLLCQYEPTKIALPVDVDQSSIAGLSCGACHTVLWTDDGACYGFGSNSHSQLPLSTDESQNIENQIFSLYCVVISTVPVLLSAVQHNVVTQVSCGNRHTLFLYQCGTVAAVGDNNHGQLGIGSRLACKTPQVLTGVENVKLLATGVDHSLAVTESGELYIWGYGKAVGYKHKDIVKPTKKLSHYTNIIQLAGGATHSLALTENGNVYSWGFGEEGQLGHGEEERFLAKPTKITKDFLDCRICQICASDYISAALSVNGAVYLWGKGEHVVPTHIETTTIFRPLCVELSSMSLRQISCGAWHVAGVVGTYQPPAGFDADGLQSHMDQRHLSTPDNMSVCDTPQSRPNSAVSYYSDNINNHNSNTFTHNTIDNDTSTGLPDNSITSTKTPSLYKAADTKPQPINNGRMSNTSRSSSKQGATLVNRNREKTTIGDFYATTPEIPRKGRVVLGNNIIDGKENIKPNSPELKLPSINGLSGDNSPMKSVRMSLNASTPRKSQQGEISRAVSPDAGGDNEEEDDVPEIESTLPAVIITQNKSRELPPPDPSVQLKRKPSDDGAIKVKIADTGTMVEEKPTVKAWNPHRNSTFNSNVFQSDKPQGGMNPKMMGFLDMSDIQLVEKPVSKLARSDLLSERHAKLYSKEMEMRSHRITRNNTNYSKNNTTKISGADTMTDEMILKRLSTQYPMLGRHPTMNLSNIVPPGQKSNRRAQVNKLRTKNVVSHTPEELESLNVGVAQVPAPTRPRVTAAREHQHYSAPTVINTRKQFASDSVLYHNASSIPGKKGRSKFHVATPDFSKAMTRLDILPSKVRTLRH